MAKKSAAQIEAERADAAADEEEQEAVEARKRADEAAARAADEAAARAAGEPVETVRMRRLPEFPGPGPDTADIHPAEVENMRQCGWVEVEE